MDFSFLPVLRDLDDLRVNVQLPGGWYPSSEQCKEVEGIVVNKWIWARQLGRYCFRYGEDGFLEKPFPSGVCIVLWFYEERKSRINDSLALVKLWDFKVIETGRRGQPGVLIPNGQLKRMMLVLVCDRCISRERREKKDAAELDDKRGEGGSDWDVLGMYIICRSVK